MSQLMIMRVQTREERSVRAVRPGPEVDLFQLIVSATALDRDIGIAILGP
jgi:hypothetical protein